MIASQRSCRLTPVWSDPWVAVPSHGAAPAAAPPSFRLAFDKTHPGLYQVSIQIYLIVFDEKFSLKRNKL
jgi:hypothetical protein